MSIFRYNVVRNGLVTNTWTSDVNGPDYYEANFGLPERWVDADKCSDADIASALGTQTIVLFPAELDDQGNVIVPAVTKIQYQLPAQYTVTATDITTKVAQAQLDAYTTTRMAKEDADALALLGGITYEHALMNALYALCVVVNPLGNFQDADISNAKTQIQTFLTLMAQIQSLLTQRDADIAAYKTSLGL